MRKKKITITKIHKELAVMGYRVQLEVLAQMTTSELHKFYKKVCKTYNLVNELDNTVNKLKNLYADSLAE